MRHLVRRWRVLVAAHICQHGQIPLDRGQKWTKPAQGGHQLVAAQTAQAVRPCAISPDADACGLLPLGTLRRLRRAPGANTAQAVRPCDVWAQAGACGLLPLGTLRRHRRAPGANTAQAVRRCAISADGGACWLLPTFANMAKYH